MRVNTIHEFLGLFPWEANNYLISEVLEYRMNKVEILLFYDLLARVAIEPS
jgi:hypothetical protein